MKNILVLIHGDPGLESRLETGLALGRALGGHLLCVNVADLFIYTDGLTYPLVQELPEQIDRAGIETKLAHEDVGWTWANDAGDAAECLRRAALLADIIVVGGSPLDYDPSSLRSLVKRVARQTRGLIVVARPEPVVPDGRAFVLWDGSLPAAHALQRAVPLLAHATAVTVVQCGSVPADGDATEAATYLSRHGIHAEVRFTDDRDGPAEVLLREVTRGGASYVVMGAFGHTALQDVLIGSVTRHMLRHAPVPVMVAG